MTEQPPQGSPTPPPMPPPALQFDRAEYVAPGAQSCVGCKRPIQGAYYTINGKIVCPNCHAAITQAAAPGTKMSRLVRAFFFGLGGAILGALLWFAVRKVTGYELGIVAIVVGIFVGGAVKAGSYQLGGRGYQIMAVLLTYLSIAAQYTPDLYTALRDDIVKKHAEQQPATQATAGSASTGATTAPAASVSDNADDKASADRIKQMSFAKKLGLLAVLVALLLLFAAAAPILAGFSNPIGLLLIAFALWQAWKINRKRVFKITGPHMLAPPMPA